MTVSSTSNKVSLVGNGTNDTFAYNFPIFTGEESTLNVYVDSVKKTLTTHYTVTGAGVSSGGNVVFTAGNIPANTAKVVIERILARTQLSDWNDYDKFPAETLEDAVDRLTFVSQEIDEEVGRAIKFATTVTDVGTVEVTDDAAARANKVFGFDNAGNLTATVEIGNFKGNWAASTAYVTRDMIKDTSNGNIYLANTSHTSSGAQPISSNTDAAKWDLIVDAASATTSATNAATSATNAATSATNAATSATNAASSATTATTQASNASTSATNAASSATSAATAQAAAEAALDNFDDIFLGAKASDPTLDNDGDALTAGDMYFNTGTDRMRVYSGSAWADVALDASTVVSKTSATGSGALPSGTTAQRDGSPSAGYIRYNTTTGGFEGYSTAWGSIGGGASGTNEEVIYEHEAQVDNSYSIPASTNAMSVGPLVIASGAVVTVGSSSTWVII
jgi:hypothetical protein